MEKYAESVLQQHQAVLLELLREFDRICRRHRIRYMLFAGSALGAVRHHGFIPWDDDLDVVMLRTEYDRFLCVAGSELDAQKYYLQGEYSDHWPMFFSKLRKNDTACLEKFIPKDDRMHQGIYIDIFPCDNLADNVVIRRLQFAASKIVIAKSLDRRGYLTDSGSKKLFMAACRLIPMKPVRSLVLLRSKSGSEMVHTFFGGAARYEKNIYPREWFEKAVEMGFEGGKFPVSANYHDLLSRIYGSYMELPPEKDRRCKVHAAILDPEHSYEIYLQEQKRMKITEYSRSIR